MKMKLPLITAALVIVILGGCEDKESTPDFYNQSSGEYEYSITLTNIEDRNDISTETGELKIYYKNNEIELVFDEGTEDELSFETRNLTLASNGYAFDVKPISLQDNEGDELTIRGVTSTEIEGTTYHGRYDGSNNQLNLELESDYANNEYDSFNYEMEILANKE